MDRENDGRRSVGQGVMAVRIPWYTVTILLVGIFLILACA
jgi:hypothetical protein